MTDQQHAAHAALVAICANLAVHYDDARDIGTWSACLREVLPACKDVAPALNGLVHAAHRLAEANCDERRKAMDALRFEVRLYYRLQAGARVEIYRDVAGQGA